MKLGTLRVAAAGQVGHCTFCHVHALLEDAAQTLGAVHAALCNGGHGAIKELTARGSTVGLVTLVFSLTCRHAVEANFDGGGPHWGAARLAAQHRLHRVAFGGLAVQRDLSVQLH